MKNYSTKPTKKVLIPIIIITIIFTIITIGFTGGFIADIHFDDRYDKNKVDNLKKYAEKGYNSDQEKLAIIYFSTENYEKAVYWFRKAARDGKAHSQFCLGVCYQYGKGVDQDENDAIYWFKKAAEQGHDAAMKEIGWR